MGIEQVAGLRESQGGDRRLHIAIVWVHVKAVGVTMFCSIPEAGARQAGRLGWF